MNTEDGEIRRIMGDLVELDVEDVGPVVVQPMLERARPVPSRHGPVMLLDRDLEAAIAAFNGRPVRG